MQMEANFRRPRLQKTRNLSMPKSNQRWYSDLTRVDIIDLGAGPLMVVMDACTRKVAEHELLRSCGAAEALSVVERAVLGRFPKTGRAPGLTLKTDGGAQFVAHRFQHGCRTIGILLMTTRRKRLEDSGMINSWDGYFRQDYHSNWEPMTILKTHQVGDRGVVDYNTQRFHSSQDYLTPSHYVE